MPTWMVVEDEPDIYDVLLAMFEVWGIGGIAFVDGAEAVAWLDDVDKGNISGELPELAILDIRLPEINGPEVGARIRKSDRLGKAAIVLITAYRLSPEEEEAVKTKAQADTLMYKPLPEMSELRRVLDDIIGKRRALTAAQAAGAKPVIPPAPTIAPASNTSAPAQQTQPPNPTPGKQPPAR